MSPYITACPHNSSSCFKSVEIWRRKKQACFTQHDKKKWAWLELSLMEDFESSLRQKKNWEVSWDYRAEILNACTFCGKGKKTWLLATRQTKLQHKVKLSYWKDCYIKMPHPYLSIYTFSMNTYIYIYIESKWLKA